MPKSGATKTYVACRPGLLQQMQSAFQGMDVEVDETLTQDYEFRQRELTGMDLVMAELEQEERMAADPKHAHTLVVPMLPSAWTSTPEDLEGCQWLLIRTQDDVPYYTVKAAVEKTKLQVQYDGETDVTATLSELRQALKDEGVNVLSISQADGITRLAE